MVKRYGWGWLLLFGLLQGGSCERPSLEPVPSPADPYSFFVAGHVYGTQSHADTSDAPYPPFVAALGALEGDGVKSGVLLGDVVYQPTAARFDALEAALGSFRPGIRVTPGNHGFEWERGRALPGIFDERFGPRNQVWTDQYDVFLAFDSNEGHWRLTPDQFSRLQTTLQAADSIRNIFLFTHNVLWWEASPDSLYHFPTPNSLWNRLDTLNFHSEILPYLQSLQRPVYFFPGDTGNACNGRELTYRREENVHLITTGMGCSTRSNLLDLRVDAAGEVKVDVVGLGSETMGGLDQYKF